MFTRMCQMLWHTVQRSMLIKLRAFLVQSGFLLWLLETHEREGRQGKKKEKYSAPFLCPMNRRGKKCLKSPQHFHLFPEAWGIKKKNKNISISTLTGIDFILNLCVCMYECLWVCLPHVYSVQRDQKGH